LDKENNDDDAAEEVEVVVEDTAAAVILLVLERHNVEIREDMVLLLCFLQCRNKRKNTIWKRKAGLCRKRT
jgi:hypothetical protein